MSRAVSGPLQRVVDLPQQAQQLALIFLRQAVELVGQQLIVARHDFIMHAPALIGQKKAVDTSVRTPLQQPTALHFVQQLAHVALGDQQRIGQLLLADTFGGPDFG